MPRCRRTPFMAAKGSVPCDHPSWCAWSSYWLCSWPPDPTPGRQTLSLLRACGHHIPAYSWSKPGGVSAPTLGRSRAETMAGHDCGDICA